MLSKFASISKHAPARAIYIKGTGLDRTQHNSKKAEEDLLIQYYENYLKDVQGAEDLPLHRQQEFEQMRH